MLAGYSFTRESAIRVYFLMSRTANLPIFYNDLLATLRKLETLFSGAQSQPDHPFRKPLLATVGADGHPKSRIIILRDANWGKRTLRLHTDVRSAKIGEIRANPNVNLAFYHAGEEIQVQLCATADVHTDDAYADQAWEAASPSSLRAYLANALSGAVSKTPISGLPADMEGVLPGKDQVQAGRKNFAAIEVTFHQIDWLLLSPSGNRRARFEIEQDAWAGTWLVP